MARQQMQKCKVWCFFSFNNVSKCGGKAQAAAPMKWSPKTRGHTYVDNSKELRKTDGLKHCQHWLLAKKNDANRAVPKYAGPFMGVLIDWFAAPNGRWLTISRHARLAMSVN